MKTAIDTQVPLERVARAVGYVINPLVLPPLVIGAVLVQFDAPIAEIGRATTAALLLMTVPPLGFLWWMVKTGRAAALDVVEQDERSALFLFGIACTVGAVAVLFAILETARPLIFAVGLCVVLAAALLGVLNLRWKVSIHATAISGFVAILLYANAAVTTPSLMVGWVLPLVPLVMWARVRTRSHSIAEVMAGAGLGAAVPLLVLPSLSAAGFF